MSESNTEPRDLMAALRASIEQAKAARTGICGDTATGIGDARMVCDLAAGHDGWHGCDNAYTAAPMAMATLTSTDSRCHWTEAKPDGDPIAAAEARGYAKAVARLRSVAADFADSAADYLEAEATKGTTDHA